MDSELLEAIKENDVVSFLSLYQEDEGILQQRTADSSRTALHLACRYGHIEMVSAIVRFCPKMVAFLDNNFETPFHEACRQGNVQLLKLLLQVSPSAVKELLSTAFNTCLFLACSYGRLHRVNFLLNQPRLVDFWRAGLGEINVAISRGYTGIVRELLNKWPELAQMVDQYGNTMLHNACNEGRRAIALMLLKRDPSLSLIRNNNGYTPPHLAAMKGQVSILRDFTVIDTLSLSSQTKEDETVFHLAVRYGHFDALVFLNEFFRGSNVLHRQDRCGNTVLHLAVSGGHRKIVDFLINKTKLEINTQNREGITALDILDKAKDSAEKRHLQATFIRAGAKRSTQIFSRSLNIEGNSNSLSPTASRLSLSQKYITNEFEVSNEMVSSDFPSPPDISISTNSRLSSPEPQISDRKPANYFSPPFLQRHKNMNKKQRENLDQLYYCKKNKHHEVHKEALLNARNTIILVAVLIATVTFAAGISPPGGVNQEEGPMKGKSIVGDTTAFKVFAVSNDIALFTSLSIVTVFVSIIPFRRKPSMRLLVIAHKVMWVAVAFMATGYVAATWVVLPHGQRIKWLSVLLIAVGGGTLGTVFIGLSVMLVKHWLRKSRWRKRRKESGEGAAEFDRESQNSDIESSYLQGYHSY